ncbi:MAG: DNA repair exonuclease [Tissierellaceae bacterium]|nr:DNA repair exonuclease [Tissierellaceae bacterium]
MVKFIHTGDLHLGLKFHNVSFSKEKAKERRRELWTTFENIVNRAREENVDFLLMAGDLFEGKYFTLGDINRVKDTFKEAENVNILISAGNHDYIEKNSLYNKIHWPKNVHIFGTEGIEKKEFPHLNTIVYGYSWDRPVIRENVLFENIKEQVDETKNSILMIHGDLAASSDYLPLDNKALINLNIDYIALGHIHKPQLFSQNLAYCGCPEPLNFGEIGQRGIIQGTIEEGKTKIELIPISKRRFIEVEVELSEDMGYPQIVEKIAELDLNKDMDFVRVNLRGYIQREINIKDVERNLEDSFYHLEIVDNTIWDYNLDQLEAEHRDNIIYHFIHKMKEKGVEDPVVKRALYLGLEELLKGDNR